MNVNIYITTIGLSINGISNLVTKLFPDNELSFAEQNTVCLSDGEVFSCSVEPLRRGVNDVLYLSGEYNGSIGEARQLINSFKRLFDTDDVSYEIELELEEKDNYSSQTIKHPDFDVHLKKKMEKV